MKVIRKGNTYRKATIFHRVWEKRWEIGCAMLIIGIIYMAINIALAI